MLSSPECRGHDNSSPWNVGWNNRNHVPNKINLACKISQYQDCRTLLWNIQTRDHPLWSNVTPMLQPIVDGLVSRTSVCSTGGAGFKIWHGDFCLGRLFIKRFWRLAGNLRWLSDFTNRLDKRQDICWFKINSHHHNRNYQLKNDTTQNHVTFMHPCPLNHIMGRTGRIHASPLSLNFKLELNHTTCLHKIWYTCTRILMNQDRSPTFVPCQSARFLRKGDLPKQRRFQELPNTTSHEIETLESIIQCTYGNWRRGQCPISYKTGKRIPSCACLFVFPNKWQVHGSLMLCDVCSC